MTKEEELNSAFNFISSIERERCNNFKDILSFLAQFMKIHADEEKKLPYHINLIDALGGANENAHSRILGELLMQKSQDGKFEILEHFIRYLTKKSAEFGKIQVKKPKITAEKEHIDLWVRDKDNYAIIIENKIHRAKDQENQLARYIKTTMDDFEESQIFVIYLPPTDEEDPDKQTWDDYEETFKERYVKLSFKSDILPWLKKISPDGKDVYLRSALEQYIDHLEGMFSLRTINNKMNMELQKFIKEKLGIQDNQPDEALETLAKKRGELEKVITQIELLESQLAKNCCHAWAEQLKIEKDFQGKGYKPIPGDSSVYLHITLSRTKIAIGLEKWPKKWVCCVWVNTKEGGELPKPVINKVEHLLNVKNKTWPSKDVDTCKDAYSLFERVIKALTE